MESYAESTNAWLGRILNLDGTPNNFSVIVSCLDLSRGELPAELAARQLSGLRATSCRGLQVAPTFPFSRSRQPHRPVGSGQCSRMGV